MRQKLVLLIALVLALAQGVAAQEALLPSGNQTNESFSVYLGQQETKTLLLSFTEREYEIPIDPVDPDEPVVRSGGDEESSEMLRATLVTGDYSVAIEGAGSQMYAATIVWATFSSSTNTISVKVNITYMPNDEGSHRATLNILNAFGTKRASVNLYGEAMVKPGDVDGDGQISVADVTELTDYILGDQSESFIFANADIDRDGNATVGDLSELIDIILGIPMTQLYTYLIITMCDGTTNEFIIDEYSKVKIAKPYLIIETPGASMYLELEQVAHLSYDEREQSTALALKQRPYLPSFGTVITQDMLESAANKANDADTPICEPSGEYENNADSQTLNTLQL